MDSENNPSNIQNDTVLDTEPYKILPLREKRTGIAYEIRFNQNLQADAYERIRTERRLYLYICFFLQKHKKCYEYSND